MPNANRNLSMRGAALLQFGSRYISMGAQIVITAVLARLIAPEDFGLVAIVTVFTGLFSLLSDMGIGTAIVQYRDLTEEDYGQLFGFSIILAVGLTLSFCVVSPLLAWLYGDSRLVPLCCTAAPVLLFSTLNMVPEGLMLKARRFDVIGIRLVCATIVSGALAIALALAGGGCYSLVIQSAMSSLIVLVWNLLTRRIHFISFHFMGPLRRIFSYSAYQFGFSLINYFSRNLDNMLIGRFMGSAQLGYYDKAYKLTGYPLSAFSSVIASVIQPFMAVHQDDSETIFHCWERIEKMISLVGVCIATIFFCASSEIIRVFYGAGWEAAIPAFSILGISVYFQMMGNPSGAFFQSLGRTDLMFRVGVINTVITLVGLVAGLMGGSIATVACGISASYCLHMFAVSWFLVKRGFGKSLGCLKAFLPEILIGFATSLVVASVFSFFDLPLVVTLIAKTALAGALIGVGYRVTGQMGYLSALVGR